MKTYYDFEFMENGKTIEPISVGMIKENGEHLYLINGEVDLNAVANHEDGWLRKNVLKHLPVILSFSTLTGIRCTWDETDPIFGLCVRSLAEIREDVTRFVLNDLDGTEPELWAWYAAYDHVALCRLYGRMIDLPSTFPKYSNDIRQEFQRLGKPNILPKQDSETEHHAFYDAEWDRDVHSALIEYERVMNDQSRGTATAGED